MRSRHSSPDAAASTSYPSSRSKAPSDSRIPLSSSTISIVAAIYFSDPWADSLEISINKNSATGTRRLARRSARRNLRRHRFRSREANQKTSAAGQVIFHAYGSVMLGDNPAGDGEAQSRSTFTRGKVRQEKPFLVLRRNAVTAIRNFDFHRVAIALHTRRHAQTSNGRAFHRLRRVINQIRHHAPQ